MTPFQAVYGKLPPIILAYVMGATSLQVVEEDLMTEDSILQQLKQNLGQA